LSCKKEAWRVDQKTEEWKQWSFRTFDRLPAIGEADKVLQGQDFHLKAEDYRNDLEVIQRWYITSWNYDPKSRDKRNQNEDHIGNA